MISKHGINIPVYKTGPGGTLRAFRLPLKKDFYSESEQQQAVVSVDEKIKRKEQEQLYLTVQDKDTIQGWHNRLGHMGVSPIKKLAASGQLHITDKDTSTFKVEECEVCAIAKITRLTFDDISVAAQEPLEIVHSDIAGPLKPKINGNIYYVTFIDDLTGLTCIGGLKTKTAMDVLGCFKNFKKITELAFNRKVQRLRTDGGGEYLRDMKPYLQLHGIVHQVTTPYTPQLNDKQKGQTGQSRRCALPCSLLPRWTTSGGSMPCNMLAPSSTWASNIKGGLWERSCGSTSQDMVNSTPLEQSAGSEYPRRADSRMISPPRRQSKASCCIQTSLEQATLLSYKKKGEMSPLPAGMLFSGGQRELVKGTLLHWEHSNSIKDIFLTNSIQVQSYLILRMPLKTRKIKKQMEDLRRKHHHQ
jgi:hypothetical protein